MRPLRFLTLLAFVLSVPLASADVLSLGILRADSPVVQGLPVTITVEARNVSGHAVTVVPGDWEQGYPNGHGLSFFARARLRSGGEMLACEPPGFIDFAGVRQEVLPSDWRREFRLPVCVEAPGEYVVEFVAMSIGPFTTDVGGAAAQVWTGEVVSAPVSVVVEAPKGVDAEVFEYFRQAYQETERLKSQQRPLGDRLLTFIDTHYRLLTPTDFLQSVNTGQLLARFPTSTYAAYVIRDFTSRGLSGSANDAIVDEFKDGAAGVLRDIPCPPSVSPCVQHDTLETRGVKALDWTAEWIDLVLKTHPDIWFADEMRLRLALDEFIAGKSALGASDLENLAKNAQPYVAEKAGQILALLKQKGIVM